MRLTITRSCKGRIFMLLSPQKQSINKSARAVSTLRLQLLMIGAGGCYFKCTMTISLAGNTAKASNAAGPHWAGRITCKLMPRYRWLCEPSQKGEPLLARQPQRYLVSFCATVNLTGEISVPEW